MNKVEILQAMNTEQNLLHWTKKEQNDAISSAVGALEKQMPKVMIYKTMKIKDYDSESFLCPICNWNIEYSDKYCRKCGQSLSN